MKSGVIYVIITGLSLAVAAWAETLQYGLAGWSWKLWANPGDALQIDLNHAFDEMFSARSGAWAFAALVALAKFGKTIKAWSTTRGAIGFAVVISAVITPGFYLRMGDLDRRFGVSTAVVGNKESMEAYSRLKPDKLTKIDTPDGKLRYVAEFSKKVVLPPYSSHTLPPSLAMTIDFLAVLAIAASLAGLLCVGLFMRWSLGSARTSPANTC